MPGCVRELWLVLIGIGVLGVFVGLPRVRKSCVVGVRVCAISRSGVVTCFGWESFVNVLCGLCEAMSGEPCLSPIGALMSTTRFYSCRLIVPPSAEVYRTVANFP